MCLYKLAKYWKNNIFKRRKVAGLLDYWTHRSYSGLQTCFRSACQQYIWNHGMGRAHCGVMASGKETIFFDMWFLVCQSIDGLTPRSICTVQTRVNDLLNLQKNKRHEFGWGRGKWSVNWDKAKRRYIQIPK